MTGEKLLSNTLEFSTDIVIAERFLCSAGENPKFCFAPSGAMCFVWWAQHLGLEGNGF